MADFTSEIQSLKPSFSFLDFDPNMELLMNQFTNQNPASTGMGFSIDNFFTTQQVPDEFPGNLAENIPGIFHVDEKNVILNSAPPLGNGNEFHQCKKRLELDSSSSSVISSPQTSDNGNKGKNSSARGKRMKSSEKEEEKPKGVVHVRARRGQATDSHSLAERVRRGKINERLKCLQDIVPGCRKTMGMAVMLDEIINYVRSLQNQVDFLSMKLTAASTFHDFNSDTDAIEALQRGKAFEAQKMQRVMRRGYEELASTTQLGPLDFPFGTYPSISYNT